MSSEARLLDFTPFSIIRPLCRVTLGNLARLLCFRYSIRKLEIVTVPTSLGCTLAGTLQVVS